ncbi:MAG: hypothetical protein ACFBWO_00805 [Paracoccaceae bacterium]
MPDLGAQSHRIAALRTEVCALKRENARVRDARERVEGRHEAIERLVAMPLAFCEWTIANPVIGTPTVTFVIGIVRP